MSQIVSYELLRKISWDGDSLWLVRWRRFRSASYLQTAQVRQHRALFRAQSLKERGIIQFRLTFRIAQAVNLMQMLEHDLAARGRHLSPLRQKLLPDVLTLRRRHALQDLFTLA